MTDTEITPQPLIVFVDTETTGLDPYYHKVWEVAAVVYDPNTMTEVSRHVWQLPLTVEDLENADPVALEMNHFAERRFADLSMVTDFGDFILEFLALFSEPNTHWAGAMTQFDERRIGDIFHANGVEQKDWPWHYHLIEVENLVRGYLFGRHLGFGDDSDTDEAILGIPWKNRKLVEALEFPDWWHEALGVPNLSADELHTAMGDAAYTMEVYRYVTAL